MKGRGEVLLPWRLFFEPETDFVFPPGPLADDEKARLIHYTKVTLRDGMRAPDCP